MGYIRYCLFGTNYLGAGYIGMQDNGYTLLETVVAIALLALLAVPLSETTIRALDVWKKSHALADSQDSFQFRRHRLKNWLQSIYPVNPGRISGIVDPAFQGTDGSLLFVAPMHPDRQDDTLYVGELEVLEDSESGEFSLLLSIKLDFAEAGAIAEEAVLFDGMESVAFAYWDFRSDTWVDSWPDDTELPGAIKIEASFTDIRKDWPDLVARIRQDEWAHCDLDASAEPSRCFNFIPDGI